MNGDTRMPLETIELLKGREQFWSPASLAKNKVFCGDDGSEDGYLHLFGGIEEIAYGFMVMKEAVQPGSVTEPLEDSIVSLAPVLKSTGGVLTGLHSDAKSEHGGRFNRELTEGGFGCKKVAAQAAISQLLSDERADVIAISQRLAPELFENERDEASALAIARAHGALAERPGIFGDPRALATKAARAGVEIQVLDREHDPQSIGIVNFARETTLNSKSAMRAGKPAYAPDMWVATEVMDNLHHLYPYDKRAWLRQVLMSSVATFIALGITPDKIFARR